MAAPAKFRLIAKDVFSTIGLHVPKEGVLMGSHGTGIRVAIPFNVNGAEEVGGDLPIRPVSIPASQFGHERRETANIRLVVRFQGIGEGRIEHAVELRVHAREQFPSGQHRCFRGNGTTSRGPGQGIGAPEASNGVCRVFLPREVGVGAKAAHAQVEDRGKMAIELIISKVEFRVLFGVQVGTVGGDIAQFIMITAPVPAPIREFRADIGQVEFPEPSTSDVNVLEKFWRAVVRALKINCIKLIEVTGGVIQWYKRQSGLVPGF
jgi:hypothetical protein